MGTATGERNKSLKSSVTGGGASGSGKKFVFASFLYKEVGGGGRALMVCLFFSKLGRSFA